MEFKEHGDSARGNMVLFLGGLEDPCVTYPTQDILQFYKFKSFMDKAAEKQNKILHQVPLFNQNCNPDFNFCMFILLSHHSGIIPPQW